MSFIPLRDVFNLMTEDEVETLNKVYDEIEEQYLNDWAEDEYGRGTTHKQAVELNGGKWVGPMSIGGYDMLVYVFNRFKEARQRA